MKVLVAISAVYVIYGIAMVLLHPRYIYPFYPEDRILGGFARVELKGADGEQVFLQEKRGEGPVVLYFMGNAGAVFLFEEAFARHLAADRHVIALEYRGGAGRPGTPSEDRLKADALLAADYASKLGKPLIVQGFSLGTGLATYVAGRRDVAGVVLSAPYDRLCRLMSVASKLPACFLPVQRWDSLSEARAITAPILVLHGTEDSLIPPSYSEAFAEISRRVLVDGAAHNDIGQFAITNREIEDFVTNRTR